VAAEVAVSLRRILVLLVLVAALGTYLFVYELPQAEREAKKDKLLAVDKEAVKGVSLVYPDRELDLRKDERGWRLVKPVDAPADEAAVKSLLGTLVDAEVQKTLDDMPSDLSAFGLDTPNVTVRVTPTEGSELAPIAVGKNTAIGGKTYVHKGDEQKLYLTSSSLQFALNKQVKDLRDKQLLAFQDDEVTRVEITPAGGETVTLTRKDKDAWTVAPGDHPADATEVRSYLSSLRTLRATDFPDDAPTDLAKYGLQEPRLLVTVATGQDGATTRSLAVGAESSAGSQKQVYARRGDQPTVYALGDWTFRTLNKTAGQFRDKTVLGFDPTRVGRLAIERKSGAGVTLARGDDGSWRIEGEEGTKPKTDAVTRYLDDLRDLRGADIAAEPPGDLARFGLDAPELRIALADKEGQAMGTVFASKHDGKHYVTGVGSRTVFEARDYMYTRLDKQRTDFLESASPDKPAAAVDGSDDEELAAEEDDEEPLADEDEELTIDEAE
jgi:hypothetical protein